MAKRIALLNDNKEFNGVVAAILADEGYEVRTATFGGRSLDFLRSYRPDLLMLDTERPWREVFALLSGLKADFQLWETPVIVFAKVAEVWEKAPALRRQNCIVLPRSIEVPALLEAVERALALVPPSPRRRQAS